MLARLFAGLGVFALVVVAGAASASPPSNETMCTLTRAEGVYRGSCAVPCLVNALDIDIDGPRPGAQCAEPPRTVAATLAPTGTPGRWLGTMEGKHPEDPTRFELIEGTPGQVRTPFGWFSVPEPTMGREQVSLTIQSGRQLPPGEDDVRIIRRARALLSGDVVWNKLDDRTCPPDPRRWSTFCALMQATTEVSGGVHYRQPALQAVREVLNEVGRDRVNRHRLMDYNNHPATTLAEIHALLDESEARLRRRFR